MEVRDGQRWDVGEAPPASPQLTSPPYLHRQASWGHHEPGRDPSSGEGTDIEGHKKKTNYHIKESSSSGQKTAAARPGRLYKHGDDAWQERQFPLKILTGKSRLPRHFRSRFVHFYCRDVGDCASGYENGWSETKQNNTVKGTPNRRWKTASLDSEMVPLRISKKPRPAAVSPSKHYKTNQQLKRHRHEERELKKQRHRKHKRRERQLETNLLKSNKSRRNRKHRRMKGQHRFLDDITSIPPGIVSASPTGKDVASGTLPEKTYRKRRKAKRDSNPEEAIRYRGLQSARQASRTTISLNRHEDDFPLSSGTTDDTKPHGTPDSGSQILRRHPRAARVSGMIATEATTADQKCTKFVLRRDSTDGWWARKVHVTATTVTVFVKDINDNAPVFLNGTMLGHVRENAAEGE